MKNNKLLKISFFIVLISIYLIYLLRSQDADMYWLIANGREILQKGILKTNPTSLIEISIVNQQWLYCILIALFDKLGYFGHLLFVLIQDILLVCLTSYYLNSKIKNKYQSVIISICLMLCCTYMINIRPQIITMCLLFLHMISLEKAQENKKWYLMIIPIIILETNLHGALVLYHVILSMPYLIKNKKINWYVALSSLAIIPLSLINPYGIDILKYSINALTSTAFKYVAISELMTISPFHLYSFCILICIFLFVICAYKKTLSFQVCWYTIIIFCLSLYQFRHTSVMYLALLVMCSQLFPIYFDFNDFKIPMFMLAIITSFISLTCLVNYQMFDMRYKDGDMTSYTLSEYIEKDARIMSNFNNGGYLEYIGFNVMIDARPEIYIENDILKDWSILTYGYDAVNGQIYTLEELDEKMDEVIKKYNFDYIFAGKRVILNRLCHAYPEKYEFVSTDGFYDLYLIKE